MSPAVRSLLEELVALGKSAEALLAAASTARPRGPRTPLPALVPTEIDIARARRELERLGRRRAG